ncbi:putative membrane protein [Pantoea anthophila]|nr:putative membrane protein [Pantoea anthophila]
MFQQHYLMWLAGIILLVVAILSWRDSANPRRFTTGLFWALYGLVFLVGDWTTQMMSSLMGSDAAGTRMLHITIGAIVVVMALIAGFGGVRLGRYHQRSDEEKQASAVRLRNKLFLPALAIPVVTVTGVLVFNHIPGLQDAVFGPGNHATLVTLFSMMVGCLIGWLVALKLTHEKPVQSMQETRRLLDSVGWAFILPQILATLGLLFTSAGVGGAISHLTETWLAVDNRFVAVTVYAVGMALLTMIMGNAFAAFPIITAGVGIPILVLQHGGNPAVMAAIGMFSGYCGTLMTPMAANFNIVPAALLELPDRNAVIRAQIPTGVLLLIVNIFLLYFLMFL